MIDPKYVESLSIEELRREFVYFAETWYALMDALREQPEVPPPWLLNRLGGSQAAKWPEDHEKGKELQRVYDDLPPGDPSGQVRARRYDIPFRTECEGGAGLWWRIRRGLRAGWSEEKSR